MLFKIKCNNLCGIKSTLLEQSSYSKLFLIMHHIKIYDLKLNIQINYDRQTNVYLMFTHT